MLRWVASVFACLPLVFAVGCGSLGIGGGSASDRTLSELVLRVGEGVGTEVQSLPGALPTGLEAALNPGRTADTKDPKSALPVPPESTLLGSGRVAKADGSLTFFVMYEVRRDEQTVADSMRELLDEPPWQVTGGRSSEGVSAYQFQNTHSETVSGTMVIQPLPATPTFDVVVSRGGKPTTLTLPRHAFVPALGVELEEHEGGPEVKRVVVRGEAGSAALSQGDRIVKVAGKDTKDIAGLQSALRSLGIGKDQRTSLVYIVQVAPEIPIQARYVATEPRTVPRTFPAPFLLLDGMTAVAVRWVTGPQGGQYEVTLVTDRPAPEVVLAYRQALRGANAQVGSDSKSGNASVIAFTSADSRFGGELNIDRFEENDRLTAVTVQVQSARGAADAPSSSPSQAPVPLASPTATPAR